jgi:uncharacterized protein (TIGR03437 family)
VKSYIAKLLAFLALIAASLFAYAHAPRVSRNFSSDASVEPAYSQRAGDLNIVSGASLQSAPLAPDSLASALGSNLARTPQFSPLDSLPTMLDGTTLTIEDSTGVTRLARLSFVSPEQISFTIPAATSMGTANVIATTSEGEKLSTSVQIQPVAPGIFTIDGSGKGLATATAVRIGGDGKPTALLAFECVGEGVCSAVPLDVSRGNVVVSFFGTGVRNRSSLANVSCKTGGLDAAVLFAGVQYNSAGPDRLDVRLSKQLQGRGDVTVVFTIDGWSTNPVTIRVQ